MTRPKPPPVLYLELWPEDSGHEAQVHTEQTGYGDDMRGNTSVIHVYKLSKPKPAKKRARR